MGAVKIICLVVVVVVVLAMVASCVGNCGKDSQPQQAAAIEYVKSDTPQTYARDGKECVAYRVAVSPDSTESQLRQVFSEVVNGDGYPMHTVWFYSDVSLATGGDMYDVAMLEEQSEGAEPVFTAA